MGTVPETVYVLYPNVLLATSFLLYFYDGHVHVPSLERGHGAATFRYNVYRAHNKQKQSRSPECSCRHAGAATATPPYHVT